MTTQEVDLVQMREDRKRKLVVDCGIVLLSGILSTIFLAMGVFEPQHLDLLKKAVIVSTLIGTLTIPFATWNLERIASLNSIIKEWS